MGASSRRTAPTISIYHHTANDTLDKVDAKALDQQVAAYAVMAYVAADSPVDFGRAPPLTGEE